MGRRKNKNHSKTQRRRGGMMEYKRLTQRIEGAVVIKNAHGHDISFFGETINKALDRLAELEDKIEQGTFIDLPCKVGDTVYCVYAASGIQEWEVGGIQISENTILFLLGHKGTDDYNAAHLSEKGKYLFFTREEAEKRLLELQGGK